MLSWEIHILTLDHDGSLHIGNMSHTNITLPPPLMIYIQKVISEHAHHGHTAPIEEFVNESYRNMQLETIEENINLTATHEVVHT